MAQQPEDPNDPQKVPEYDLAELFSIEGLVDKENAARAQGGLPPIERLDDGEQQGGAQQSQAASSGTQSPANDAMQSTLREILSELQRIRQAVE